MKGLQDVAGKWFLIGILAATPVLAQNAKEDSRDKNHKDYSHDQGSHKRLEMNCNSMDTDGDGKISKTEFDRAFARMDTNGDGYLSSDECQMGETKNTKEPALSAPQDVKIR